MSVALADRLPMRSSLGVDLIGAHFEGLGTLRRIEPTSRPSAWILDIDGTLLKRVPGGRGPYDWDRVHEDVPNPAVIEVVHGLAAMGNHFIVVSGRPDVCRWATVRSLTRHVFGQGAASMAWHSGDLFMRDEARKSIPDDELKEQILLNDIQPRWEVKGVIDDRDRVVAMWRRHGLTCLQVGPGDF